jgi:hypothetical protein
MSLQISKLLFETSIHSSNIKKQSGLAGKAGICTSGEMRKSTRSTGVSIQRSTRSPRRKKAKQSPDKSTSGEYNAWQYAALGHGTSSSPSVQFTSDSTGSLGSPERKGTPSAKTRFMSKKRAEKSE